MYSTSHQVSGSMNGLGGNVVDGSGTINPAALDPTGRPVPLPSDACSRHGRTSRLPSSSIAVVLSVAG